MKHDSEKPDAEPGDSPTAETEQLPLRLGIAVEPVRLSDRRVQPAPTPPPLAPPFAAVGASSSAAGASLSAAGGGPAPPPPAPARSPAPAAQAAPIPEGDRWTGAALRRARQARGLSVAELSERTRVTRHHIDNIERDQYELLPAAVYVRGILMALAKELRLDGQKVARAYLEAARNATAK